MEGRIADEWAKALDDQKERKSWIDLLNKKNHRILHLEIELNNAITLLKAANLDLDEKNRELDRLFKLGEEQGDEISVADTELEEARAALAKVKDTFLDSIHALDIATATAVHPKTRGMRETQLAAIERIWGEIKDHVQ